MVLQKTLVTGIRDETARVRSFTLRHAKKAEFPPFSAGAHVAVETPSGLVRHYSLCSDPHTRDTWRIAVLREDAGGGGSKAMHAGLSVGDTLYVTRPRNYFSLGDRHSHVLLLAGGIGITPIMTMAMELERRGEGYDLHYCARNRADAAFADEVEARCRHGRLHLHFDHGVPANGLDIPALLQRRPQEATLYACGPKGFLDAVVAGSAGWPRDAVRLERFTALPAEKRGAGDPFEIVIQSTGQVIPVATGQTALTALREAGHSIRAQCEGGICGTCRVPVIEGEVLHRDIILTPAERAHTMMVCVSRAAGRVVVAL